MKKSSINIEVNLDENKIPEEMFWSAPDGGIERKECKALLMSFWDSDVQETLKMDLWVKTMPIDQMKLFFYQTLLSMSDSFYNATKDEKMTQSLRDFCKFFGENLKVIKK